MAVALPDGRCLKVNRAFCDLVGHAEYELWMTDLRVLFHPEDRDTLLMYVEHLLAGRIPTYQMERRLVHKHGFAIWVLITAALVRDEHDRPSHLLLQVQDTTDRKRAEDQLIHDAFHDALTGLPNRALFIDHLKLAIERVRRHPDRFFAVLFLDLDRFKVINDSLGHMVGDQLLIAIARKLESCLRPGDTVARLGGDEFTILVEDLRDIDEAKGLATRIQEQLTRPFNLGGREVFTTVSIGIAPSAVGYERPEDFLRDADTAMYRAKSLGRACYEVFDRDMHARAMNRLQLETDLRRALERREMHVHYQPIVSLKNFNILGFEALLRWQHPERGLVSPEEFIATAEETGLIVPIGKWVISEACRQMKRWQTQLPVHPHLSISINISSKQFMQPDLIDHIKEVLRQTGINPHNLRLELTESVVMENVEKATGMLQQLREIGTGLSIDDFGTGYSSLSYLHRFPIDILKIDRSFVGCMTENNENLEIVRTIVMLAQNLGMEVVAEGVETKEQLALLTLLKCDSAQGYYFSRPTEAAAADILLLDTLPSDFNRRW